MAETTAPATLTPLPLSTSEGDSIVPATNAPPATPPAPLDLDDAAEAWMTEHPTFEDSSTPPAATETTTPPAATTAPTTEAPPTTTTPTTEATTPPAASTESKPAETTPPPAPKPALAADEKITLSDGVEWTRGQIVEALRERHETAPLAKEAQGFQHLFGMNAEEARNAWGPLLKRLATERDTLVPFLDAYLNDPKKADYLNACAKHYDQQSTPPSPATVTPAPAVDPQLAREVAELRSWREAQEKQASAERVNREWQSVTAKYPFLATDENLRNALILTAQALYAQDPTKGLLDAVALNAATYDAMLIARQAAQPTPAPTPAPPPALLGSPGAAPNGSQPVSNGRPKSFDNLDDAVDEFLTNPPPEFRG